MASTAPTVIDLSSIPAPDAIETLSFETLNSGFVARFQTAWAAEQVLDPTLPDLQTVLDSGSVQALSQAWAYCRLDDRARVNDAVKAVLAPLAEGADLDNIVARIGIQRLVITPAVGNTSAVMETDAQLLRRYLLAFDRPSAGSADRFLYEAFTACPELQDAVVNGYAVHGRPGDVDIVIAGPGGAVPTTSEIALVLAACQSTSVKPEATRVSVLSANRATYNVNLVLQVPGGPDAATIVEQATARVQFAAAQRLLIGAQVPMDVIAGYAYGANIIKVDRSKLPPDVPADPYTIPVMTGLNITAQVLG